MLLIDAINVKSRGGSVLLEYLEAALIERKIKFKILRNQETIIRYRVRFNPLAYFDRTRKIADAIALYDPHTLLCFGNFPPGRNFSELRTFTYIQSRFFVDSPAIQSFGFIPRVTIKLKRLYLKSLIRHSEFYIFQTPSIQKLFIERYDVDATECMVLPFFDEESILIAKNKMVTKKVKKEHHSFIYPSGVQTHKNIAQLIQAWSVLLQEGVRCPLNLMIPDNEQNIELIDQIARLNIAGAKIINHGALSHKRLLRQVYECSHVIFPSKDETIGLGIVEGLLMDCEILVSDEPYHLDIVNPTATFDCDQPTSIAAAVQGVLAGGEQQQSHRIIQNQVQKLITTLVNSDSTVH